MASLHDLEQRVLALENSSASIDDLVQLLEDVRGALRVFIKVGNACKWLVGLGLAIAGPYYAIRHWMGL